MPTVLITGANSGIGKETSLELARKGFKLLLYCRSEEKAERALKYIEGKLKRPVDADIIQADLSDQASIADSLDYIHSQKYQLDVVINNAGAILGNDRKLSKDGHEMTFAANHLGHFQLTMGLLPLIKSNGGRIVHVSSEAHRIAKFDLENLQGEKKYDAWKAYGLGKLCNILFSNELARRLKSKGISSNSLHPGVIASNFGDSGGSMVKIAFKLASPFLLSAAQGAQPSIYLASDPELDGKSGYYFKRKALRNPSKAAQNETFAKQLWEISEGLCK